MVKISTAVGFVSNSRAKVDHTVQRSKYRARGKTLCTGDTVSVMFILTYHFYNSVVLSLPLIFWGVIL